MEQPAETLYNRWKRSSDKGVIAEMLVGLAAKHGEDKTVMNKVLSDICPRTMPNVTYLKAHRTATSLAAKFGG